MPMTLLTVTSPLYLGSKDRRGWSVLQQLALSCRGSQSQTIRCIAESCCLARTSYTMSLQDFPQVVLHARL